MAKNKAIDKANQPTQNFKDKLNKENYRLKQEWGQFKGYESDFHKIQKR